MRRFSLRKVLFQKNNFNNFVYRCLGIGSIANKHTPRRHNPHIDAETIEVLITPHTKAIVVVHYAGIACDMLRLKKNADKYNTSKAPGYMEAISFIL
ncbi:DegT/DnrJ/EryC1/StrS family aminotransferase [Mucilaginibacter sp. UYCu711]|uniref:DegT/DnrJ/EryC1/StrS family aminotransferase n=1 Tax=Mucilaginibacter sp. UYCu711 TaxID=3156339 RepID=UPI003D1CAF2A